MPTDHRSKSDREIEENEQRTSGQHFSVRPSFPMSPDCNSGQVIFPNRAQPLDSVKSGTLREKKRGLRSRVEAPGRKEPSFSGLYAIGNQLQD